MPPDTPKPGRPRLLLAALACLAVVFLARDAIARVFLRSAVTDLTGLQAEIGAVDLALLRSEIELHDVRLRNPDGFGQPVFVEMPEIFMAYRLPSIVSGNPHIETLRLVADPVVLEKNAAGESNIGRLKAVLARPGAAPGAGCQLDLLEIHVGRVILRDDSGARPIEHALDLNLDTRFRNVTDATDIGRLVILTIAGKARLTDLGFDQAALRERLERFTDSSGLSVKAQELARKARDVLDALRKSRKR